MKKYFKTIALCCLAISLFSCHKGKTEMDSTKTVVDSTAIVTKTIVTDSVKKLQELKKKIDTTQVQFHFTDKDYKKVIPKDVQKYITKNFKNWSYPNASHWDKFWFKNFSTSTSLVNFIQGDFNLDHKQDYAFFLENPKEKKIAYILIQGKGNSFETVNFREMSYKGKKPKFDFGLVASYECDSVKCTRTYVTDVVLDKDSITGKWKEGKYIEKRRK